MKRAACYIRVSTEDQIEYSPDSQLREIRGYAERNNLTVLEDYVFIDEGISGRSTGKRAAFQRMITAAKQTPRPFDVVLLYKYSRFARNREDSVVFKSMLRNKCGVDVISITEPLDPDNKMSGVIEAVIESMDEYYSANLSEDVTRTMTEKAMRGELQSPPPFGYAVRDNMLYPVEAEAAVVKEIFGRFVNGEGCCTIARDLNDRGVRTHRGNRFENRTLQYILQNPAYVGKLRWTPSAKGLEGPVEPIVRQAGHPQLVSLELFQEAQRRLQCIKTAWHKYQKPQERQVSWVSGLVRCQNCGSVLCYGSGWWRCNGYAKGRCKSSQLMRDETLKELILACMEQDLNTTDGLKAAAAPRTETPREQDTCRDQLRRLSRKIQRAKEAYLAGVDSVEEYEQIKRRLEEERKRLQIRLDALAWEETGARLAGVRNKGVESACALLKDPAISEEEKKRAARAIVRQCTIDKENGAFCVEYFVTLPSG